MKRFFLIAITLVAMAFSACQSCKKDGPYNSKPVTIQVEPKTEVVTPKITPPRVVVPKTKQPKVVVPKAEPNVEPPKMEPEVVIPKVEPPKTESKLPVVPKIGQPKKHVVQPKISIVDYWIVSRPHGHVPDLFAITFVVKNPTLKDVKIKVVCHYTDGSLFGESIPQTVDANSDAKLMVRGFKRCPNGLSCLESFDCRIEAVN